jgi:hypothetical protein
VYQGPSNPWGISPGDFSELEDLANHTLNEKTLLQKLTSACQGCSPLQRSAHNHGAPYFWLHHWLYIPSSPTTMSVSVCSISINTRMWAAESPKNHTQIYQSSQTQRQLHHQQWIRTRTGTMFLVIKRAFDYQRLINTYLLLALKRSHCSVTNFAYTYQCAKGRLKPKGLTRIPWEVQG